MANKKRKNALSDLNDVSEMAGKINKYLNEIGIQPRSYEISEIIKIAHMRIFYLELQDGLDKRSIQKELDFRIGTLKRLWQQSKRDQNGYNLAKDSFIQSQIFLVILEKALLILEQSTRNDIRDMLGLSFHLELFSRILTSHEIPKPVYVLADLLNKVEFWNGFKTALQVSSLQNSILRARKLIDKSIEAGACHIPNAVSKDPRWYTRSFVRSLSQGCPKCEKIWSQILGVEELAGSPWSRAVVKLREEELSFLSKEVEEVARSLESNNESALPLEKILELLPYKYRGAILSVISE